MNNIPWHKPYINSIEKSLINEAFESSWLSSGEYVKEFESQFADSVSCSKDQIVAVNSGTAALHLALLSAKIQRGDEIIIPGFGFAAAVNVCILSGATPILADVCPRTWCLDISQAEKLITPKTKAIIAIHNFGVVSNVPAIIKIANKYDIKVIEDAAESCFSSYSEKMSGTLADYGCFSFQSTKTITTGEGGAVYFKNIDDAKKSRLIASHGMSPQKKYWHEAIGHNFRLTNIQAAIGIAQLSKKNKIISSKNETFNLYKDYLKDYEHISFQHIPPEISAVMWTVTCRVTNGINIEKIRTFLEEKMIETRPGFCSFFEMPAYDKYNFPKLKISESLSSCVIMLPSYVDILNSEIKFICDNLTKAIDKYV